jgi:hypothetical protein
VSAVEIDIAVGAESGRLVGPMPAWTIAALTIRKGTV